MSDIIETTVLHAVAAFEHGVHYVFATMDDDGLHTHEVSRGKLEQVAHIIGMALDGVPSGSIQALKDFGHRDG